MIQDFLSIGIIGALLSVVFQWLKASSGTASKLWMIGLSIVVGGVYFFFSKTTWWVDIIGVLAAASTVYALFINNNSSNT